MANEERLHEWTLEILPRNSDEQTAPRVQTDDKYQC